MDKTGTCPRLDWTQTRTGLSFGWTCLNRTEACLVWTRLGWGLRMDWGWTRTGLAWTRPGREQAGLDGDSHDWTGQDQAGSGAVWRHQGNTQEASSKHIGGTHEAPRSRSEGSRKAPTGTQAAPRGTQRQPGAPSGTKGSRQHLGSIWWSDSEDSASSRMESKNLVKFQFQKGVW